MAVDDDVDALVGRAGDQVRHRGVVGHECLEHRIGNRGTHVLARRILAREAVIRRGRGRVVLAGKAEPHERLGIVDGNRFQKQPVDGAEQGGVGANAQGQREDDDGSPAWGSEERAEAVADVSQHDGIRRFISPERWVTKSTRADRRWVGRPQARPAHGGAAAGGTRYIRQGSDRNGRCRRRRPLRRGAASRDATAIAASASRGEWPSPGSERTPVGVRGRSAAPRRGDRTRPPTQAPRRHAELPSV